MSRFLLPPSGADLAPEQAARLELVQSGRIVRLPARERDTETTGSITSGTTALTVASAAQIATGDTLYVRGAGAGGAALIADVTAVAGTTVTLSAPAGTTVADAYVSHDDTARLLALLATVDGSGDLLVKLDGATYRVNGELLTANGYNARLPLPHLPWVSDAAGPNPITLMFEGVTPPAVTSTFSNEPAPFAGTTIYTDRETTSANAALIGGPVPTMDNRRTLLNVVLVNLTLRQRATGGHTLADLRQAMSARITDVRADVRAAPQGFTPPALNFSGGVFLPDMTYGNNYSNVFVDRLTVFGHGIALMASEHAVIGTLFDHYNRAGVAVSDGHHAIHIERWGSENTVYNLYRLPLGPKNPVTPTITVNHLDIEASGALAGTPRVYDPGNYLRGEINFTQVQGGVGKISGPLVKTGGANLRTQNLLDPVPTSGGGGGTTVVGDLGDLTVYAHRDSTEAAFERTAAGAALVSVTIPASGSPRTFAVSGAYAYKSGASVLVHTYIALDGVREYPKNPPENYSGEFPRPDDSATALLYSWSTAGVLVTVPGDNAPHTLSVWANAVQTFTPGVTLLDRSIVALQIA